MISLPFCATGATTGWAMATGTGWAVGCRLTGLAVLEKKNKTKQNPNA